MKFSTITSLLVLTVCSCLFPQKSGMNRAVDQSLQPEEENLNVFHDWLRWTNPGSMLIRHLNSQAFELYAERDEMIAELRTAEDWRRRQGRLRETLLRLAGPFPKKTPVKSRLLGTIKKDGYRVEKIVFESFPDYWVPGCLFVPDDAERKAPAVLNVIGHNQESFRAELYQVIILNLVKKGIIVFAIDPPGQGEHVQVYDTAVNFSYAGYSVAEHSYIGNQCLLSGISSARYFIWDGIRAIDYLCTRREVDPEHIGVTGFSGGGTITSYLGAIDERVKVAVPCSWSTASRRQLETKGAQDAEANLYHGLKAGLSFEDLIELRAPKPTLLTFVTRDEYLSVQGAIEAHAEINRAYSAFGQPEMLELVIDDSRHWMTKYIREHIYAFFIRHFRLPAATPEQPVVMLTEEELQITPSGQIATSFEGRRIFDLNLEETSKLLVLLEKSRENIPRHLSETKTGAREISGYIPPRQNEGSAFLNGRYRRPGYTVAKYAIPGEGDYAVPILLFIPDRNSLQQDGEIPHPGIIYLHPNGKAAEAAPGGEIENLVLSGIVVAAVDVPGVGELRNTASREMADGNTAVLIGRSIPGIQAGDIVRVVNYLKQLPEVDSGRIGGLAHGTGGIPLLHAAAFEPAIQYLILVDMLLSYRSVATNIRYKIGLIPREGGGYWHPYDIVFSWAVPGALTAYDLPDLIGCIAPRKVALVRPRDHMVEPLEAGLVEPELAFPRRAYQYRQAAGNFRLYFHSHDVIPILDWCLE